MCVVIPEDSRCKTEVSAAWSAGTPLAYSGNMSSAPAPQISFRTHRSANRVGQEQKRQADFVLFCSESSHGDGIPLFVIPVVSLRWRARVLLLAGGFERARLAPTSPDKDGERESESEGGRGEERMGWNALGQPAAPGSSATASCGEETGWEKGKEEEKSKKETRRERERTRHLLAPTHLCRPDARQVRARSSE